MYHQSSGLSIAIAGAWMQNRAVYSGAAMHVRDICPLSTRVCETLQGCGVVWPTTIGKLELNLCKVLKTERFDKLNNKGFGLQVGFSPAI